MKTPIKGLELNESGKISPDELVCKLRNSFWHAWNNGHHFEAKNCAFYGAHYSSNQNLMEHVCHFHGLVQFITHDLQGAYKLFLRAIEIVSRIPKPLIRQIQIWEDYLIVLERSHRYLEGHNLLQHIEHHYLEAKQQVPVRFFVRASFFCRALERYEEVKAYLERAKKVDPNDTIYLTSELVELWEGYLLSSETDPYREHCLKQMTSIQAFLEKNTPDPTKDATLLNNSGALEYLKRDYKKSVAYVNNALEINPDYATAYFNKGLAEFRQGNFEVAKSSFEQAQIHYLEQKDPARGRNAELFVNISEMKLPGKPAEEEGEKEFLNFLFDFLDTIDNHQNFFIDRFVSESHFYQTLLTGAEISGRDNELVILRGWHSSLPPLTTTKDSAGGGYFLRWRGMGIVIDPGFNFVQHFFQHGFSILDIDLVVLTSSVLDHCNDFETLLSLFSAINSLRTVAIEDPDAIDPFIKEKLPPIDKKVDLILSPDAYSKFETQIKKLYKEVIGDLQPLDPDKQTVEWQGINSKGKKPIFRLGVVNNKISHDEDRDHPLGIVLELLADDGSVVRRIGYTSDTVWTNDLPRHYEDCEVILAHIGPIRAIEFKSKGLREEKLNPEHLGLFGCFKLLTCLRPKLFVISDMGRELSRRKSKVVGGFNKKFFLGPEKEDSTKTISSELGMIINLSDLTIETQNTLKPIPYVDIEERFDVPSGKHLYI